MWPSLVDNNDYKILLDTVDYRKYHCHTLTVFRGSTEVRSWWLGLKKFSLKTSNLNDVIRLQ
jgi:hypothetical protein